MAGLEEDPLYLKKFVKDHPNNKMGWYLLGKQYETQGKKGKAKYCFAHAGDVYSAFEMMAPIELNPVDQPMDLSSSIKLNSASLLKKRVKMIYRTVILVLFILAALTYLPENTTNRVGESIVDKAATKAELESGMTVYYIDDGSIANDIQKALKSMITPEGAEQKLTVIVKAPKSADGRWVMWQKAPAPLLSAERDAQTGTLVVSYHDSTLCECSAVDAAAALAAVNGWQQLQEQLAVLRSTMTAYAAKHGSLPKKAQELTRNYPENSIPGLSEWMQKAFNHYAMDDKDRVIIKPTPMPIVTPINEATSTQPEGEVNLPTDTSESDNLDSPGEPHIHNMAAPYAIVPPLTKPLEIVVDPDTHQLALVSGDVIIRKYPVGLGGDKTPQGSFVVTEKVRNPNGRDDGDFGSRGMTLSNTLYAIHGTNKPNSIGLDESLGCIRMHKEDVEELFDMAPLGTKVTIGKVKLPSETTEKKPRFHSPQLREETNPGVIYKWLD